MTTPTPIGADQPADITSDAVMERVAEVVGDTTPQKVAATIAAWHAIHEGDPVGTVRRDPETGAIAVRAEDGPMHLWRVSVPDGTQYNDLQPTLPWPIIHAPEST